MINVDYRQVMAASNRSPSRRRLTAQQAAHRLGIKVETVYAYVSRGYLSSERSVDGRTSTFDGREVERLARRGRPRRTSRGPTVDVAIETELTDIDGRHLRFRGHDAVLLSRRATFEQVAALLWTGMLPERAPSWGPGATLPFVPEHGDAVGRLRTAVALAGMEDPVTAAGDLGVPDAASVIASGPDLIAAMVGALPVIGHDRTPRLHLDGMEPVRGTVAGRLAIRLQGRRPSPRLVAMVNAALVLLADHEMAASTFAARIAASARADAASVVSAGLGPLAGALHGTAGRAVRAMLADAARTSPDAAVGHWSAGRSIVPGVGHRLYPRGDPRAVELLALLHAAGGPPRELRLVDEVLAEIAARGLGRPNVDLALGAIGHVHGMVPDAGEAVFAVARTAGWLAHAAEELGRRPLRFRTRAAYVGPPPLD
jgi:citrate synthase